MKQFMAKLSAYLASENGFGMFQLAFALIVFGGTLYVTHRDEFHENSSICAPRAKETPDQEVDNDEEVDEEIKRVSFADDNIYEHLYT